MGRLSFFFALGFSAFSAAGAHLLPQESPPPDPREEPVVQENRFSGLTWIPARTLEAHLRLPPGSPLNEGAVKEALERLLSFRFIETAGPPRVEYVQEGRGAILTWPVKERPLIRRVRIEQRPEGGSNAFSREEILEGLLAGPGKPLVRKDLEGDRETIRMKHIREGYLLCEVQAEARTLEPGAVEVAITVDEGPRVWLRSIEIEGIYSIPARHIRAVMGTRPRILFGLISRGVFDPKIFAADLEKIRELYRSRGYLEAIVAEAPRRFSRGFRDLEAAIQIEEGPRYILSAVRIHGNGPGVPSELLLKLVRTPTGVPCDGRSLEEDRRRLSRWYQEHYDWIPQIEILFIPSLAPEEPRVTAVFEIHEGMHLQIGKVDISGNLRTRDRVIRRALTVRPGGPLTEIELGRSMGEILGLRYFDPQKLSIMAPPGSMTRDVEVKVEEVQTWTVMAGGGASSGEGEIAYLGFRDTNFDLFAIPGERRRWKDAFSGGGQLLELSFAPGTKESEYQVRFVEPYIYNSSHSLSLFGGLQTFDRDDYDETRRGGELSLRRYWDEDRRLSTRLGYVLDDVEISDVSRNSPPDVTEVQGHTLLSYPTLRLTYDSLEHDPLSGPAGLLAEARGDAVSRATGSETAFLRTTLSADLFQPVSEWINGIFSGYLLSDEPSRRHILRIGGEFGWADGFEGEDVPIFERFFLGGPRSFRGFDYRGVGPEADGVRVGGRSYYHGMVEYSFPLVIPELRAVGLFEFADVGEDFSRLSAGTIRTAAGGGLRINLRLLGQPFPFDFYFVQALRKEREDDARFFTFTLGFGF